MAEEERRWRGNGARKCLKLINHFDPEKTEHEAWFEDAYLPSLSLKNRRIKAGDFEGVLYGAGGDVALFELKLITLQNHQEKVNAAFEEARRNGNGLLIPSPQWEEIKSRVRDNIGEAVKQLLERMPDVSIPRIVFLALNTPDVAVAEIEYAITGGIEGRIVGKELRYNYRSETSDNREAVDLFFDPRISGLIALTLCSEHPYDSFIFRNAKATTPIPSVFEREIERNKILP